MASDELLVTTGAGVVVAFERTMSAWCRTALSLVDGNAIATVAIEKQAQKKRTKTNRRILMVRRSSWTLGQFWQRFACRLGRLRFHHAAAHCDIAVLGMNKARPRFGFG